MILLSDRHFPKSKQSETVTPKETNNNVCYYAKKVWRKFNFFKTCISFGEFDSSPKLFSDETGVNTNACESLILY